MTRTVSRYLALAATCALVAIPASFGWAQKAAPVKPRMVMELFTSQGCSSCPPADKVAAELAKQPDVVVLSMPVDYWDYLGWRDTLASPAFTERQRAYGRVRGDRQIYTPQAVVNGTAHAVGSELYAIDAAARSSLAASALTVSVQLSGTRDHPKADIGAATTGPRSGSVWLLPVAHNRTVAIGRGENSGATVTYTNVVRAMIKLGDWDGTAKSFDIASDRLHADGADGYVVILQAGTPTAPGVVLGAAQSISTGT